MKINSMLNVIKYTLMCYLIIDICQSADLSIEDLPEFHRASSQGNIAEVERLLASGIEVDTRDQHGRTPFLWAVYEKQLPVARLLLQRGANIAAFDSNGHTTHVLIGQNLREIEDLHAMSALLSEYHEPLAIPEEAVIIGERHKLHRACRDGEIETARDLLRSISREEINRKDLHYGRTPLMWACASNQLAIAELLLSPELGTDINAHDQRFITGLILACEGGHIGIASLLLDRGARQDFRNKSPMSAACHNRHFDIVRLLREHLTNKADIGQNARVLHDACHNGDMDAVNLLLDLGFNIEAVYKNNTPLGVACFQRKDEIAVRLVMRGAKIENRHLHTDQALVDKLNEAFNTAHNRMTLLFLAASNPDLTPMAGRKSLPWFLPSEVVRIAGGY